jgi:hypothetical protein
LLLLFASFSNFGISKSQVIVSTSVSLVSFDYDHY